MKNIKLILVLSLIVILAFTSACGKKEEVTMGELKGTTYTNKYFGLKFQLPADWVVATEEEKEQITNAGQSAIAGENKELDKQIELSKEKTLNLVFAFKYPLDYIGGINPNFMCIAENLDLVGAQIKSGEDYLNAAKSLMEQAGFPYEFSDFQTTKIGDKDFIMMEASLNLGELVIKQRYYSSIIKGYALNFSITFSNEEELAELDSILNTIEFSK